VQFLGSPPSGGADGVAGEDAGGVQGIGVDEEEILELSEEEEVGVGA
jgi:hypothetical protein